MSPARHPIHFGFMATVGVGFALLLYFVLINVGALLAWIAAALFIALGLDPIVRWLERKGLPRPAGVIIVVLILAGLVAAFISTLIPTIVNQTTQIVANAPRYVDDFLNSAFFQSIDQQFQVRERIDVELAKFFANSANVTGIFGGVLGVGSAVLQGAFGALIVLVLTLYFLASLPALKIWAYRLAPRSRRQQVQRLSEEISSSVGSYVIGQACVALINATVAFIAMSIAQVPFTALLTFVVALLAFIPLIGAVIAGALVSLVALTVSWQTAALFAVIYFAYLQIEAYFVSPRVMQRAVAVPGAVAVIAVIAGGFAAGGPGRADGDSGRGVGDAAAARTSSSCGRTALTQPLSGNGSCGSASSAGASAAARPAPFRRRTTSRPARPPDARFPGPIVRWQPGQV